MKKKLIIFLYFVLPLLSFGQRKIQSDTVITNMNLLPGYISEHYSPNKDSVNNNCLRLCVFVKFAINAQGKIDSVSFTKGTPNFMIAGLQKSIIIVNGFLKLDRVANLNGKIFIVPIIIDNNQGCGHEYGSWEIPGDSKKLTPQLKQLYFERQVRYEQTAFSIRDIISFSDESYDAINCVLLRAGWVSGVVY